ncbi:heavy metal translocating P-type ATPase [Advenella kashmirensis WT001]|uniref:Heavy metal translocating P-type ATPase n=1 Tax=Advenella kashmirensis (strain DSM 17095 / LMG 22695 / WT001) TaxID=1036672 RepID=I3UGP0_ADVKW|nr:heavy metal translocating P-type ATPase [Advenella kashmirensis WT001]
MAGMTCASCVRHVENALSTVPGVQSASVNLATERAQVRAPLDLDSTLLTQAVVRAGYEAQVVSNPQQSSNTEAARRQADRLELKRDLLLAVLLALPVFILEMGAHAIPAFHHFVAETIGMQNSWYLQFVLTSAVLAGPGRRFFVKGIPALLRLTPDMNSLVAVGTTAAYLFSVVATFVPAWLPSGTVNVYYEAAAVIVAWCCLDVIWRPGQGQYIGSDQAAGRTAGKNGPGTARCRGE